MGKKKKRIGCERGDKRIVVAVSIRGWFFFLLLDVGVAGLVMKECSHHHNSGKNDH